MQVIATAVGALLLLDHVEEVAARGSPWPASASSAAAAVLARMTSDEKCALLYGHGDGPYDGTIPAMPNVGIPALRLQVSLTPRTVCVHVRYHRLASSQDSLKSCRLPGSCTELLIAPAVAS